MLSILVALVCTCSQCVCDPIEEPTPPNYHESCEGPQGFSNGNLWKPRGENSGSLVVLLRAVYPEFDVCEVRRKDGSWEAMEFTGYSNATPEGERQTYRGRFPGGGNYAGKKKDGGVRCFINDEICEFPIPGPPKNRHD